MTDFEAIDALLAAAREEVPLPPAEVRRGLREGLSLSRAQVAQALGVSPSTVGGWETGRDPGGEVREKYAYFLEGARTKLEARAEELAAEADEAMEGPAGGDAVDDEETQAAAEGTDLDDVEPLSAARPCVLCGGPALHQVAGFPQHLDPAECGGTADAAAPSELELEP
ncbi:helix-turn-helix domain-containing protein, partial [Streptomyces fulvoviolaceus]|uniref:helix-turn-helix domain-containing protein n=1 Tax=Streptomyces fulvoviolaceus TaxID=285535 RepID=UPI0021BF2282